MDAAFEKALIEALDALEAGQSVSAILDHYPDYAAELRPLLTTASTLSGMRIAHSLEAQAASRQRMLQYAAATTVAGSRGSSLLQLMRRLALGLAGLMIILALLSTGALVASSEAVPGDALYEAKRFFEDARLSLTSDVAAREELQQSFERTRVEETKTLLRMGRTEQVSFAGTIEAIADDSWLIAGIEVFVHGFTVISGTSDPAVGDLAEVNGLTAGGGVDARSILIRRTGAAPEPEPEPDSAETPAVEPTPTGTASPTPTATQTPAPTSTIEPVPPGPTATPSPEASVNGNDNDNANDDDDETEPNDNGSGSGNEGNSNGGGNDNESESNENGGNDNDNESDDDESNENRNENDANENRNENDANENRNENDDDNRNEDDS